MAKKKRTPRRTRQKLTAWEWFAQAEQFELAAMVLLNLPNDEHERVPAPLVVVRAFALEAYFKCLLTLGKKAFPWKHDLDLLFALMRQRDKRNLSKLWRIECGKQVRHLRKQKLFERVPLSLKGVLEECGDAFRLFRYLPEEGTAPFLLFNFPRFVRSYVFKRLLFEDPKPEVIKAKNDGRALVAPGFEILNRESAALGKLGPFIFRNRGADPNDGGTT